MAGSPSAKARTELKEIAAAVAVIASLSGQLVTLEAALTRAFSAHRDAEIVRSQPGLGLVLAARVLAEGRRQVVWHGRSTTGGWPPPATCGPLPP